MIRLNKFDLLVVAKFHSRLLAWQPFVGGERRRESSTEMVSKRLCSGESCRFIVRPNRSLTPRQQRLFFLFMCTVVLGIAGAFAMRGFWPVLPFAGLEIAVLAYALWHCARSGTVTEVISVAPDRISVDKGRGDLARVWETPLAWAQVRLDDSGRDWYPSRLVIRSHGKEVQLGGFLNEDERQRLAVELRRAVAGFAARGWHRSASLS